MHNSYVKALQIKALRICATKIEAWFELLPSLL